MNMKPEEIDPVDVGERLRIARETVEITQAEAAASIEVARTTLVAIEQGRRRIRMNELQRLSQRYGTTINALLRREAIYVDLAPRFRKFSVGADPVADEAVRLMSNLAKAELELENLLGVKRIRNYPPERPILPGDVRAQAEQDAIELRQRLGLGIGSIPDIVTLLEMELGVRVYVRKLDGRISGVFAYDEKVGPCMLLNANHRRDRRTQSAAHECGHFISTRREPEILETGESETSREERYASSFGRAFLTPARGVNQKFQEIITGSDRVTRRHIIILAHYFGVSREAMTRRLEELKLIKGGTWDWFTEHGGITDDQERQVLGDLRAPDAQKAEAERPTTLRLSLLAAEAYRREILSEGQLAQLLHLDRIELRAILNDLELGDNEADGSPNVLI